MNRGAALALPALLVLAVVFLGPVGWLLSRAFTQPRPGLENFALLWERTIYLRVLLNTVMISAVATPICVLLGYPVAHAMAYGSPRRRRWLIFLVLVPFWTSLLVRSFATVILLQRTGPVNALLTGIGLISEPLPLLYNLTGVMLGALQVLLPFVIFPIYATMSRIEPVYMQAALTLGSHAGAGVPAGISAAHAAWVLTGATLVSSARSAISSLRRCWAGRGRS